MSGIEYYLLNLITTLTKIDRVNEYYVFLNKQPFVDEKIEAHLIGGDARINVSRWPSGSRIGRLSWDYLALERDIGKANIDVFHGPSFSIPLAKACPSVVTVHDLSWHYFPDSITRLTRLYFKALLPLVTRKADLIITDSKSSKVDIVERLSVPDEKVVVVYPGVSGAFRQVEDLARARKVKERYGIANDFILNVSGLITPRKNLKTLFKSYADLREKKAIDQQLVVVGTPAWSYKEIFQTVRDLDLERDIVFTGSVPLEDLVDLYNVADLFVFPSLYEGFGFPVLEAMACGTVVVTSNTSSLPELAGDAGILIDPLDAEELSAAIHGALEDQVKRKQMVVAGLKRVEQFSWEVAAEQMLGVYKSVVTAA